MSNLSIVTASLEAAYLPASVLRQKAIDVPADIPADGVRDLVEGMLTCLYTAGGVGLAAPQVGIGWRLLLAKERDWVRAPLVLINPRIVDMSDEQVEGREGCLSLPGYVSMKVPRSMSVKVEALNQFLDPVRIEDSDFLAKVIQHEYDHLDGILYPDRLHSLNDLELYSTETQVQKSVAELFSAGVNSQSEGVGLVVQEITTSHHSFS